MASLTNILAESRRAVARAAEKRERQRQIDKGADKSPSAFIEALHVISDHLQPGQYLLAADGPPTEPAAKRHRIGEGYKAAEQLPVNDSELTVEGKPVGALPYLRSREFGSLVDFVNAEVRDFVPMAEVQTELKPWQRTGQERLVRLAGTHFGGGFLADPVGLGKSLTALTVALRIKYEKRLSGFVLVCCPK
jgi:hypothetical protein